MEGIELICFQIISAAGTARSYYIEAAHAARDKDFDKAASLMEEGNQEFNKAHTAHAKLIQQEAGGEKTEINLLLVHAEDQIMSAETIKIIVDETIEWARSIEARV
jgi:PTS system cellobiose-specific IIA component